MIIEVIEKGTKEFYKEVVNVISQYRQNEKTVMIFYKMLAVLSD